MLTFLKSGIAALLFGLLAYAVLRISFGADIPMSAFGNLIGIVALLGGTITGLIAHVRSSKKPPQPPQPLPHAGAQRRRQRKKP